MTDRAINPPAEVVKKALVQSLEVREREILVSNPAQSDLNAPFLRMNRNTSCCTKTALKGEMTSGERSVSPSAITLLDHLLDP